MIPKGYLIGHLTADPILGVTSNSNNYSRFSVACNESFQRQNQTTKVHYFNCVCWGVRADYIQKNLKKGDQVFLEFSISTGSYTNSENRTIKTVDFIVEKVELLRKKQTSQSFVNEFTSDEETDNLAKKMVDTTTTVASQTTTPELSLDDIFDN